MEDCNQIIISPWIYQKIRQFYLNMSMKREHVYGIEEIFKLIDSHYDSSYGVGKTYYSTDPIITNWRGARRMLIDDWNYAVYKRNGCTFVLDTCHYQNLYRNNPTVLDLSILPNRPTKISLAGTNSNRFIRCLVNENPGHSLMKKLNQKDLKLFTEGKCDLEYLANKYFAKDIFSLCERELKLKR